MNSYFPNLLTPAEPLSVAGLTAYIQVLLEQDDYLRQIWVTGEVSSATRYKSGLFFTLQDPDEKAAISCVAWSSQLEKLATLPTQGEQLIILGRIHLHPQRGQYQLVVWQVLPGGEGLRALRSKQLRNRLELEGLFDPSRKRSLPPHPRTIGVVTSPQAAAWGDIQRTLRRRYPGLHVVFSPAFVQGDQAPESISKAIQRIVRDGRSDVLIISRGGGAIEDMGCFNDERVVRAIADCPIPIISGIGHQRDESLADLAADVCAHTPTAAAEQAVPSLADLMAEHRARVIWLTDAIRYRLETVGDLLQRSRSRLQQATLNRKLQHESQRLEWLKQRLVQAGLNPFQQEEQHCQLLQQKLATLDPTAVLQRGYALVRQANGAIVRSAEDVAVGEQLRIQLGAGRLTVQVTERSPD
jgi:exodeoxyribonuclease VII large subunit